MLSGLLFAAAASIVLVIVFDTAIQTLERQISASVQADARTLMRLVGEDDVEDIAKFTARLGADHEPWRTVIDRSGKIVVDQLGLKFRPTGAVAFSADDLKRLLNQPNNFEESGLIGFGVTTPNGDYVFVGQDDERLTELRETLLKTVVASALAIMAFAIGGGIFVSLLILRRLNRFTAVADAVTSGAMASRMPVGPRYDEYDELATRLNAMLEQLEASMGSLKQVTSDIAHDLRTPLTRLRQRLEAIGTEDKLPERQVLVTKAVREADDMLDVFASLLRIAQIEAGAARVNFVSVDLSQLLLELADIYQVVAAGGSRSLSASIAPAIIMDGDRALLQQLFTNLIENSLTHTPSGSAVTISLQRTTGGWRASVTDNGPGIPLVEQDRVFDRFYRLEKSRTTPGTGLGLALVKAIAHAHGLSAAIATDGPGTRISIETR